jgi:hypothetical protein
MALTREDAKQADRALPAIDNDSPARAPVRGIRHLAARRLVRLHAAGLHPCDRHDLDGGTLLAVAIRPYPEDPPARGLATLNTRVVRPVDRVRIAGSGQRRGPGRRSTRRRSPFDRTTGGSPRPRSTSSAWSGCTRPKTSCRKSATMPWTWPPHRRIADRTGCRRTPTRSTAAASRGGGRVPGLSVPSG